MSQTDPLKPIAEPAYTIEYLNPDKPNDAYRVYRNLGKKKRKTIEWALSLVAQREMLKIGTDVTQMACERWIMEFSRECEEANLTVLERLVEPSPGAASVAQLFWDDKFPSALEEELCAGFTMSSSMRLLVEAKVEIASLKEQIANSNIKSEETSHDTEKQTIPSADTNGATTENSLPVVSEPASA